MIAASLLLSTSALAQNPPDQTQPPQPVPGPVTGEPSVGPPPPAPAPAPAPTATGFPKMGPPGTGTMLMLGPETWVRFAFQGQFWINYQQALNAAGNYSFDEYLRRARFFMAIQAFKDVSAFILFDSPNLGKAVQTGAGTEASPFVVSKQFSPMIVQDAYGEIKLAGDAFILDVGLMVVPFSHNGLQSTSSYLGLDVSNTAAIIVGTSTSVLRDTGFQFKGYELDDHLVFRLFVGSGLRQPSNGDNPVAHNAPRITGHVQYYLLDPDVKGYVYSGMNYGRKKILTLSAGFDFQKGDDVTTMTGTTTIDPYWAVSAGFSGNYPLSGEASKAGGDEIAFEAEWYHLKGGGTFPNIGDGTTCMNGCGQNAFDVEASYFNKDTGLGVFGKFELQKFEDDLNKANNKIWVAGGLKWYMHESFTNFTFQYQRLILTDLPDTAPATATNQFTLQTQVYYF